MAGSIQGLRRWLAAVPVSSELERRHAVALQLYGAATLLVTASLQLFRTWSGSASPDPWVAVNNWGGVVVLLAAVWSVRTGRFRAGLWLFAGGMTAILGLGIVGSGLTAARDAMKNLAIPLAVAALALGRRALWLTLLAMAGFLVVALARDLLRLEPPPMLPGQSGPVMLFVLSLTILVLLAIVLDRFGLTVLEAFSDSEARGVALATTAAELRQANEALALEGQARRRAEAQLLHAQKMEAMARLSGGVAHDFNNLLTVILGGTEFLRERRDALPAECAEEAEQIHQAAERGRDLTRQLLAFARKQALAPVSLDLGAHLQASQKLLRRVLGEDVRLEVRVPLGPWLVLCDPGQLDQVLVNLAVNARDAMPSGGDLTIAVGPLSADAPERQSGEWVQLLVSDTGTGLSPEVQSRLFEPFFTTKEQGKGTGLGLSTVHGIVMQLGGQVLARSAPGRGATFEVRLPRTAAGVAAPADAATDPGPCGNATILVVEDEAQVREFVTRALARAGYRLLVATSGAEGLDLLRERAGETDLLLADVVLPGVSGHELAGAGRRLRPDLAVLLMSGYSAEAVAERGGLDAPLPFLAKPFTTAALLGRVRQVLESARSGPPRPREPGQLALQLP